MAVTTRAWTMNSVKLKEGDKIRVLSVPGYHHNSDKGLSRVQHKDGIATVVSADWGGGMVQEESGQAYVKTANGNSTYYVDWEPVDKPENPEVEAALKKVFADLLVAVKQEDLCDAYERWLKNHGYEKYSTGREMRVEVQLLMNVPGTISLDDSEAFLQFLKDKFGPVISELEVEIAYNGLSFIDYVED